MGLLFTQKDDDLLYIIKRAAEKLEVGTWANLSAVYNDLATSSMTKERLKSRYMAMDKTAAESRTSDPAWDRAKIEAEERLRALCEASPAYVYSNAANRQHRQEYCLWMNPVRKSLLCEPLRL